MKLFAKFLTSRGKQETGAVMPIIKGGHVFVSFRDTAECHRHMAALLKWQKKSRRILALARRLNKETAGILFDYDLGWLREMAGPIPGEEQDRERQKPEEPQADPSTPGGEDK